MKKQVVLIHGGDAHNSYNEYVASLVREKASLEYFVRDDEKRWKDTLADRLGGEYEVFFPDMPNKTSAKYLEWKIWFDKLMPFLEKGPVFVGHSLGGIFLARYFAENPDRKKARGVFLVAAPYVDPRTKPKDRIADFILPRNASRLQKLGDRVHLYHSSDDPVVSPEALERFKKLLPHAQVREFSDRKHFRVVEFPEIVDDIRKAFAKKK